MYPKADIYILLVDLGLFKIEIATKNDETNDKL